MTISVYNTVYATGLTDKDLSKAQVGISRYVRERKILTLVCKGIFYMHLILRWYEGNPCNMHLLKLGQKVKQGVNEAGLVGYQFNTIGVR
jgi:dihydroxy-acid dehydratase